MNDKRPNILFFFPDQMRAEWLGFNSELPLRTPSLDGLAAHGVHFVNAVSPSPLCAPCRAIIASGRDYESCGVPSNAYNYPLDQTTIYTLLRESGYHVIGCGKFDLHKPDFNWGRDGSHSLAELGFSDGIDNEGKLDGLNSGREKPRGPYINYLEKNGLRETHIRDMAARHASSPPATFPTPLADRYYCDNWIGRNGLDLLEDAPRHKPWFLQVNFTGPHPPMDVTEKMAEWYSGERFPLPTESQNFSREEHQEIRRRYAAMIENIDLWVGRYLDKLRERGELENTLIVFSSDHGEMLGDHDRWGKCTYYQGSLLVPLIIAGPGVAEDRLERGPTTILDLSATFLEIAGLPVPPEMDSRTLMPVLKGSADGREFVRSGLTTPEEDWRLVYDGRHKLVRTGDGERVLYDTLADPHEKGIRSRDHSEILKRLSREL